MKLTSLVKSFDKVSRTLLNDVDVEAEGTIRINTTAGAHLKSQVVIDALKRRDEQKAAKDFAKANAVDEDARTRRSGYCESAAERRHFVALALQRTIMRASLNLSRIARRAKRRAKALAARVGQLYRGNVGGIRACGRIEHSFFIKNTVWFSCKSS